MKSATLLIFKIYTKQPTSDMAFGVRIKNASSLISRHINFQDGCKGPAAY